MENWTLLPNQVPVEALMEYWAGLPAEHRCALFQLREEDFAAELDAHLKYQLRICRDCRGNVYRAYRRARARLMLGSHRRTVAGMIAVFVGWPAALRCPHATAADAEPHVAQQHHNKALERQGVE